MAPGAPPTRGLLAAMNIASTFEPRFSSAPIVSKNLATPLLRRVLSRVFILLRSSFLLFFPTSGSDFQIAVDYRANARNFLCSGIVINDAFDSLVAS